MRPGEPQSDAKKIGRNDRCFCGSGKKYKQCCMRTSSPSGGSEAFSVPSSLRVAIEHHRAGRWSLAEAGYRRILELYPNHSDALHYLGLLAARTGKLERAVDLIGESIKARPDNPSYYNNLGAVLREQNRLDEAVVSFRKAVTLKSDYAVAHDNLGIALLLQDRIDEAIAAFRVALTFSPERAEANHNLGMAFLQQSQLDQAAESFRRALSLKPNYAEAHNLLGVALQNQGKLEEATVSFREALLVKPEYAVAYNNLGNALADQGKLEEALDSFRKALLVKPDYAEAYSNLLFVYGFHDLVDSQQYLSLARGWELATVPTSDRQVARNRAFKRPPVHGRRLKLGYVSGDYRQHAVSCFIEQLFSSHDRSRVELFAYATRGQQDAVTIRLQNATEHWVSLAGISDTTARDRIEADGIDVLVDLSGHTAHNRLGIFARRAAPIQAYYLGFFASTGLTEIDYWIGDEILTPVETDGHFSEQVWRLPRACVSYSGNYEVPPTEWEPAKDGAVWVGGFNSLGKLTPATLALWARVLHALPTGRLLIKASHLADAGNRERILESMAAYGIPSDRITLQDSSITPGWTEHMGYYDRLDVVLDPVGAMGGATTTCDALWMAVPVVTLIGDRVASRMTASMLTAVGHPEWIARSEEEYVNIVVALARDVAFRKNLRLTLRSQMAQSSLCDAADLATHLENAYAAMFQRWLEGTRHR